MDIRILSVNNIEEVKRQMHLIGTDEYGIRIMALKSELRLIKIAGLSNIAANVLKQELLSLGADAAISRGSLTGASKKTDCLVMANRLQLNRLNEKLRMQPFKLGELADQINTVLDNYERDKFLIKTARFSLDLSRRVHLMGIVNITDDSFSGDGLLNKVTPSTPLRAGKSPCLSGRPRRIPKGLIRGRQASHPFDSARLSAEHHNCRHFGARQGRQVTKLDYIIRHVEEMVEDGADIIDIGGESTRPGARPVSLKEELNRTIPIIKLLSKRIKVPISIDTYKTQVAREALDAGASIVNDIMGTPLDGSMARLVAKFKASLIIMHIKGRPSTMQNNPQYKSLMSEIISSLKKSLDKAVANGLNSSSIIIDPGIGFGKTAEHNLCILKNLSELKCLGRPILVGPSRKSFIGKVLGGIPAQDRLFGTAAACALAVTNGAKILRIHDIKEVKQLIRLTEAINKSHNADN